MTPKELMMIVEAYNHRQQIEQRNLITNAYLSAAWHRAQRMPRLSEILNKIKPKEPPKPQTPEEMLAIAKRLHFAITREGKEDGRQS